MKCLRQFNYRIRTAIAASSVLVIQLICFHLNWMQVAYWFKTVRKYPYEVCGEHLFYVGGTMAEIETIYN